MDLDRIRHVTFICGRAGVCALGAVVAKHVGDDVLLRHYLNSFREVMLLVCKFIDRIIVLIF